jgi:hypothetical protein
MLQQQHLQDDVVFSFGFLGQPKPNLSIRHVRG